jgi:hypothetical protein
VRNRSLITWGIILAILIGSGVLTILLPALLGGDAATPLPSTPSSVTIPLPVPIGGRSELTLLSWQIMLALALLVPALVIGAGLTLALVYIVLSRLVARNADSSDQQQNAAALQKRQDERIKRMRETRPTSRAPESTWRRWSVITTAAVILMFVAFGAFLIASMLFPAPQIVRQDNIVNIVSLIVLGSLLMALIVMIFSLRADRLAAIDRTENLSIPWDFIAVIITGLVVVGLGIGVIAILNAPQ